MTALSVYFTNSTTILDVYGGGGRLFGGTYIICLYIGMLFGKYYYDFKNKLTKTNVIILSIFFIIAILLLWRLLCVNGFTFMIGQVFGSGLNPPGLWLMLYATCIMMLVLFFDIINESLDNIMSRFIDRLAFIGTKTLDIFLYHKLFMIIVGSKLQFMPLIMKIIVLYSMMIGGSIVMGYVFMIIKNFIIESYKYKINE